MNQNEHNGITGEGYSVGGGEVHPPPLHKEQLNNSLRALFPSVAKEWHPTKNGNLKPECVAAYSHEKVWWLCNGGHEWEAIVSSRSKGAGCPYCSGRLPIVGETDLGTLYPNIASEWHSDKNGDLKPVDVAAHSNKRVWWRCKNDHEWVATANGRTRGNACPYCVGYLPIRGETDFKTLYPQVATEWHPALNGDLCPDDITAFSKKKVWWKCEHGHEWQADLNSRTRLKNGCPYCSGRRPIRGETDLKTLFPKIATEWHPTKNGEVRPEDVCTHSGKKIWWRCKKGHEWKTTVYDRTKGSMCPYCRGILPIPSETDLLTVNYQLASEWHPTLNGELRPENVTAHSGKKVWWSCEKGHEWQATINNRSKGKNCPYCSGKRAWPGETDLQTMNPNLAAEWHPTLNGDLCPENVTIHSGKRVWWRCSEGHEWQATVSNRANGSGCPYEKRLPVQGRTDLQTMNPDLAAEWHPTLNGNLRPENVTIYSGKKVWWRCPEGHEWQATVGNRTKGSGCPHCIRSNNRKK